MSSPENGPRVEIDRGQVVETQTLVERGPKHPAGPGVSVVKTFESKKDRK